jgi:hypothetical protein
LYQLFQNKTDAVMKHAFKEKSVIILFFVLWLLVNLLQAFFTGLAHDEAYYWMYSRHLDWGYFDHPPMVALLIKAGYMLFQNELGVRLVFCLLSSLTLWLIYKMYPGHEWMFIFTVPAMALFHTHVAGFLAIPDIPLVFFTVLFLFVYKKYLESDSTLLGVIIGLAAAGMLYSKYHGILVIAFVWLSNINLVNRKSFWLALVIVIIAMTPHLYWQIKNHFPTFRYHLVSRTSGFDTINIIKYVYNQILIAGPLIAPLLLFFSLKRKPADLFEKALKFILVGFYVFFFISSFRGHIEAHWTAAAFPAMLLLARQEINSNKNILKWLKILSVPSMMLFFSLRFIAATGLVPSFLKYADEFNEWNTWAEKVKETAGGKKVAFLNKYQYAAKYTFYTGDTAISVNTTFARKNQYDLWHLDDAMYGKTLLLNKSHINEGIIETPNIGSYSYSTLSNFQPFHRIIMKPILAKTHLKVNDSIKINCYIKNPTNNTICLKDDDNNPVLTCIIRDIHNKSHEFSSSVDFSMNNLSANASINFHFKIEAPQIPGEYAIYVVWLLPWSGFTGNAIPAYFEID